MQRILACALLLVLGCASTDQRPPAVTPPLIELLQPGAIFFGNAASTATTIDVEIQNRATVSITVREVAISSFAMTDYHIIPVTRRVTVIIPPGETRTVGVVTTLEAESARSVSLEPLSVRAVVRMQANGKSFREVVMQRLTGTGH